MDEVTGDLKAMTIAQTERPSYRSKKRYAKFGKLQANKDLKMHQVNRPRKKYLHRKVNLLEDLESQQNETIKSNSLIRINNLKKNIKKKSEIKEKLEMDDKAHAPIQVKKSKLKLNSQQSGKLKLKNVKLKEMKKVDNNEIKELLRSNPEPEQLLIHKKKAKEAESNTENEFEERSERQTNAEERKTVVLMNEDNEFEIQKLTEDEIKETHLFQSTNKEEEVAQQKPETKAIDLNLEIEDSQIGHSLKQAKRSNYGSNLKARVDNFQPPHANLEVPFDYK